jgi:FkbM family methyltransferase
MGHTLGNCRKRGWNLALLRMLRWSFELDCIFLFKVSGLPIIEKTRFVILKYLIYLKNRMFGVHGKHGSIKVFGSKFFYNDVYGLASLQRVYCSSYTLKALLPDHPVIIDVGANVGQFNFFCKHYLRAERVISIEPIKDCYDLLLLNSGKSADCVNKIVSTSNNEMIFYIAKRSSQLSSYIKDDNVEYIDSYSVQGARLDDILDRFDLKRADLLKIDTEGSEFEVLSSATGFLGKVDHILVEMSIFRKSSGNLFKVGGFLEERAFDLVSLATKNRERPRDVDGIFKRRI